MKKLIFSVFPGISFCGNAQCYGDNISTTATIGAEISLTLKQDGTFLGAGYGKF